MVANERASDIAYRLIKQGIVEGKFTYGEKLSKRAMADYCGVSIIPVIDALNRLEGEGLVESHPYYGSRVIEISEERIADYYLMREAVETQAVRVLCYTIGLDELKALAEKALTLDRMVGKTHEGTEFDDLHYAFHLELVTQTKSHILIDALQKIHLFDILFRSERQYQRQEQVISDYSHRDVVDTIARRNAEEATRMMRKHIYRSNIIPPPLWAELGAPPFQST